VKDFATLDFNSGVPVYRQIMNRVRADILAGKLSAGDQLPTIRELHQQLGVNPNTVVRAYRELELAGDIQAEQGSGCYVSPPSAKPKLAAGERTALLNQLCARFAAEAQGSGFSLQELITRLSRYQSP